MANKTTIDAVLTAFLEDQEARLAPRTFGNYLAVVDLLSGYINNYAYMSLEAEEERAWREAYEAGDENAFTAMFGPDRILEHYADFLSYYMVAKVMASEELLRASGTVTRKLAAWLEAHAHVAAEDRSDAAAIAADAARDLPKAERLSTILYDWTEEADVAVDPDDVAADDFVDDYLCVERVEPGRIWFERSYGPVAVPEAATDLAQPGWTINVVLARVAGRWHLVEVGNVYP